MIDLELDLRRLEAKIGIGEDEHPALARRLLDVGQHIGELPEVPRRGDDELHRRPARRARQRRRREDERKRRRDPCDLRLKLLQHRLVIARPFIPGLEENAGKALMHVAHAVDGEDVVLLRDGAEDAVDLLRRLLEIVEIGVLRRLHEGEQDALVLLRREFLLRRHIHEAGRRDHAGKDQKRHWPIVEGAVEAPLIAPLQPLEQAVEVPGEPSGLVMLVLRLEQLRAHHRRQRHGDDARDDHGAGQGQRELPEENAR